VKMFDHDSGDALLDSATVTISDGEEFVFYSVIDAGNPAIQGGTLDLSQGTCSDFQYSDLPQ